MKQIQQHEWEKAHTDINSRWDICSHCKVARFRDTYNYNYYTNFPEGKYLSEEPACITRPINAPLRQGRGITIKYIYFVSYNFQTINGTGFGSAEMTSNALYTSIEDIRSCEKAINENQPACYGFICCVTNYILLRTIEPAPVTLAVDHD